MTDDVSDLSTEEIDARLARLFVLVRVVAFFVELPVWLFDILFFRKSKLWRARYASQILKVWRGFKYGALAAAERADSGDLSTMRLALGRFEEKNPWLRSVEGRLP